MRRRAQMMRGRRGGPWRFRQGFGCIFGILFLVVVASIVTAVGAVLSNLEPIPILITALVVIGIIAALARGTAGAARDLDTMLAATRRVEDGDYGVRVGRTRSICPRSRSSPGFGHDGRAPGMDEGSDGRCSRT